MILPFEQKGCQRKARGCKDQLLLNIAIAEDAKRKQIQVIFMWADYKKSYDSVPHLWLTKILDLYKIDKITAGFITKLIPFWRTQIYLPYDSGCVRTDSISIKRGIFQGNLLSSLLFCLALAPISHMFQRVSVGTG